MSECFPCKDGKQDTHGYFVFKHGPVGGEWRVHRWIYKNQVGELLPGEVVRHTCDHPWCGNPDHLIKGSQLDNIQDRVDRNRCRGGSKGGENHPNARLTSIDVAEIKTRYDMGETQQALADEFGVSRGHISGIVRGKKWS